MYGIGEGKLTCINSVVINKLAICITHLYNTRLLILWHLSDTLRPYFSRNGAESLILWEKVFQKLCVTGLTLSGTGKTMMDL